MRELNNPLEDAKIHLPILSSYDAHKNYIAGTKYISCILMQSVNLFVSQPETLQLSF